jgi:alpha-beta hydrolase superfamily lysophospholipase
VRRRHADDILYVSIDPSVTQKGMIFCLHGLGLNCKSFAGFASKVNRFGYGVIALDVRGFGRLQNEKGLDKLDLENGLEDLAAAVSLFRSYTPDLPIFVLGESMGGALALQLTAKYPDLVAGLISSVPSGRRYRSASTGLLVGIRYLEDKKQPIEIGKKVIEQATDNQAVRDELLSDPASRLTLSPQELVHFQEFMSRTRSLAKEINKTPVIVFQGFKDHLVKPEGTFALYEALAVKDKQLVMVGEAEHLIFEEGQAPDDVVGMLAGWLDSHRAKKSETASK